MKWQPGIRNWATAAAALLLLAACANRDDAQAVLLDADRAMGGANLKTLRFAGSGTGTSFGQAYQAGMAWPRINVTGFSRVLDYQNGAMREEATRSRAEPTGGSGLPLTGEQRAVGVLKGNYAWNMAGPAPAPAPVALEGRIHDLWTSPHGVIKAALKQPATLRSEGDKRIVSFNQPGAIAATVWIGADSLVERVESVLPNPVLGDTPSVTQYSGYRDFGGVKFPTRIQQSMGGFPVLDLRIDDVQPNVPAGIEVPAAVQGFTEKVVAEKAAEGVWFLAGGSHNSALIEMNDHVLLVEAPLYDGRTMAVLAEARRLVPGKPVRYVINSHHHFDHSGGLRTAAADGATLVVSEQARPWFERAFANPNGIKPDALARSGRKSVFIGVDGRRSFTDGTRTVEVMLIEDSSHAQGFMMVWLPRERVLIEADAYTPGAPNAPPPQVANANNVNLVLNIERMKLNVDRILPLHGRLTAASELYAAIGRKP